jgi:hypothetical protein
MNNNGEILGKMIIGQSGQRLVRIVPGEPCLADCIRVMNIQMKAKGPDFCNQGSVQAKAKAIVTDENGNRLQGVTVTAHFMDDYWLDEVVTGVSNNNGQVVFIHTGPPCVGAIAILVTGAASNPSRTLDETRGILTNYVIPMSGGPIEAPDPGQLTAEQSSDEGLPSSFGLSQNYPNPFNPGTTIAYQIPTAAHVSLTVTDVIGRIVATLVDEEQEAGKKSVFFDASGLTSGLYFYRLQAGSFVETRKLLLVK